MVFMCGRVLGAWPGQRLADTRGRGQETPGCALLMSQAMARASLIPVLTNVGFRESKELFVISGRSVKQLVGLARRRGVSGGVMPDH